MGEASALLTQGREKGETSDCKEEQEISRRRTRRLIHTSSAKVSILIF